MKKKITFELSFFYFLNEMEENKINFPLWSRVLIFIILLSVGRPAKSCRKIVVCIKKPEPFN